MVIPIHGIQNLTFYDKFVGKYQGSLYYQPKQDTIIIGEIPQNYPTFALFDPPKNR